MRPILAIGLIVIGIALLIFGIGANDSFQSSMTKLFSGVPSERAQWLLIGGAVAIVVGSVLAIRRSRV
jgi:Protein of unknown function (DUF3185)